MARLPSELEVTDRIRIPAHEIDLSYARSGGPGGQHVNKTSTKVLLRWNLPASGALPDEERARLVEKLATRLTEEGDLLVTSERHRDQSSNVEDALAKFVELLRAALRRPKRRRKTKPTASSKRKRLEGKRRRSDIKRRRQRPGGDD